ncbi:MAG: hypothetical protein WCF33_07960 [Pseudonocardiaceae bacterium]
MSAMVDDPATEDIASRVTGGEIVPLASRATWLATGSSGADTVTTLELQFDAVGVVSAGLVGGGWRGERGGRLGPCWSGHGHQWWSSPEWSAGSCSVARAAGRGRGTGACPSDAQRTNPSRTDPAHATHRVSARGIRRRP